MAKIAPQSSSFWQAVGRIAPLMFIIPPMAWSVNVLLARGLADALPPVGLAYWRWTLALIILLPFGLPGIRRHWHVVRRNWKVIVACGVLGIAGYHSFLYLSLQTLPATNAALINSAQPLIIPVAAMLLAGDRIGPRVWAGLALSLVGVFWVVTRGDPGAILALGDRVGIGELWILISLINWALYSVVVRWRPPELNPLAFLTACVAVALVVMTPFLAFEMAWVGRTFPVTWTSVAILAFLALIPSIAAYLSWNRSVQLIGSTFTGLGIHVMTIFIALGSLLILNEPLESYHFIGIALVLGGVAIAVKPRRRGGRSPGLAPY